uniref:HTH psq-type domain-containing protein n=1 Tax=Timema monikensis TaxID=170555 RepID=A0A7R9EK57_9NEOP|nr:unnamed protein product [Timema monikensis]
MAIVSIEVNTKQFVTRKVKRRNAKTKRKLQYPPLRKPQKKSSGSDEHYGVRDKPNAFLLEAEGRWEKRTKHSPKQMLAAILSFIEESNSVRASAKTFNIDRKTLERYVRKSTELCQPSTSPSANDSYVVSPEIFRPFPKAGPRKTTIRGGRRSGKTRILTDTPVKNEIQEEFKKKEEKKRKRMDIKNKVSKKLKFNAKCNDDSDEMTEMDSDYSDPDNDLEDFEDLGLDDDYSVGDFVLVNSQ